MTQATPKPQCSTEGCKRPVHAKGLCNTCTMRLRRRGSTKTPPKRTVTQAKCSIKGCSYFGKVTRTWCPFHYGRWHHYGDPLREPPTVEERFWEKVNKDGPTPERRPDLGPCWMWTASKHHGYGRFTIRAGVEVRAHRFSYTVEVGPIPDGLQLDHLCRNPSCVRPSHLEPVTCRENLMRGDTIQARNAAKTHCDTGHEFTPGNTRLVGNGWRRCKTCEREAGERCRTKAKTPEGRAKAAAYKRAQRARNRANLVAQNGQSVLSSDKVEQSG